MRLAILAALGAGALLAWLNVRDLIHRHRYCYCSGDPQERHRVCCGGTPHRADPMDAVQADPWTSVLADTSYGRSARQALDEGLAQAARGETVPYIVGEPGPEVSPTVAGTWDASDEPYIDNPVLVNMRRAYGGRPLGGT